MLSRRLKHPHHADPGRRERQRAAALLVRLISRSRAPGPLHHEARHRGEVVGVRQVRTVLRVGDLVDDCTGDVGAQPLDACGGGAAPTSGRPGRTPTGTSSAVTSKGGPSLRMLRRSATSAGPSARRWARPSSVSRAHAPSPTIRPKKRSASSPGSSASGGPRASRPAGGSPARAWAARRRRWRRRPAARPARRRPRRCRRGCARSPPPGRRPRRAPCRRWPAGRRCAPRGRRPRRPGSPGTPPVVGQGGELGQPAHRQPEAVAPVERSVDEHHRARIPGVGRRRPRR